MKKFLITLFCLALAASILTTASFAFGSAPVSPALDIIAAETCMVKSGLVYSDVVFSADDFINATGITPVSITMTSLPPANDGTLMLGSSPVSVNQTISTSNLNLLRFVPEDDVRETSFRFTYDRSYTTECQIKIIESVNFAPKAENEKDSVETSIIWTQSDISCFGKFAGYDPDGDEITFEITKFPEKGLIEITNTAGGNYKYTPYEGVCGVDSVSYRIRDEYGNYSDECDVSIKIDERVSKLVLADMTDHWGYNAALSMIADSSMSAEQRDGTLYFNPDDSMTRQDFLTTVMKALGAGELSPKTTVFADNSDIKSENSGYIAAAYKLGIINGEKTEAGLCFRPNEAISRAEAAVILNRIIGSEAPETLPVFSDSDSVPTWAQSDLYALASTGILNGTASNTIAPNENISRAQTAQILFAIKNLYLS